MTRASIIALLLAAAAPVAAQRPTLPSVGVAAMDVAGVKLGMTEAAARAAMAASGYRIDTQARTLSFDQKVRAAVAAATGGPSLPYDAGKTIQYLRAVGPHAERLVVDFESWPAGALVDAVTIDVDMKRQSGEEFFNQVRAKYGAPTFKVGAGDYRWCSQGEKHCAMFDNPQMPLIHAVSSMDNRLELRSGEDARLQRQQALKDAIDRQVPSNRRTAF